MCAGLQRLTFGTNEAMAMGQRRLYGLQSIGGLLFPGWRARLAALLRLLGPSWRRLPDALLLCPRHRRLVLDPEFHLFGYLVTWWPTYGRYAQYCQLAARFPDASGELADADGDHLPNGAEMRADTDPTEPQSALRFEAAARLADLSAEDQTVVDTTKNVILYFKTVPGKTCQIQSCANLGSAWVNLKTRTATTTQTRAVFLKHAAHLYYRAVIAE
jgi:hypothetical protein